MGAGPDLVGRLRPRFGLFLALGGKLPHVLRGLEAVEYAQDCSTASTSFSGLSSRGQGRRWLPFQGCPPCRR